MVDRLPPHDIDAEEALLGSIIIDSEGVIRKVSHIISDIDFYSERNRIIYNASLSLFNRRVPIEQVTLGQELARLDKLEDCGGAAFLSHLISVTPTSLDCEYYADIVHRLAVCRNLIAVADQIAGIGYQALPDIIETVNKASALMEQFRKQNHTEKTKIITPREAAETAYELMTEFNTHAKANLMWGYRDLDNLTTGIFNELIILGARPSVGKTQLMIDVARKCEAQNKRVLFATSEMSLKRILERQISTATNVSVKELRLNGIQETLEGDIMNMIGEISEGTIHYLTGKLYAQEIYNAAELMKEQGTLDIVFVDYLQFLADCWEDTRENQNIRVGRACKVLKNIVENLNIPVIVASQLSRSVEFRPKETKQPTLADLRDSGNIEQDADVVLLLYRNQIDDFNMDSHLQIKMAKNRQLGTSPHISLAWSNERHCYVDEVQE